jgi:hypothetical protein
VAAWGREKATKAQALRLGFGVPISIFDAGPGEVGEILGHLRERLLKSSPDRVYLNRIAAT